MPDDGVSRLFVHLRTSLRNEVWCVPSCVRALRSSSSGAPQFQFRPLIAEYSFAFFILQPSPLFPALFRRDQLLLLLGPILLRLRHYHLEHRLHLQLPLPPPGALASPTLINVLDEPRLLFVQFFLGLCLDSLDLLTYSWVYIKED